MVKKPSELDLEGGMLALDRLVHTRFPAEMQEFLQE